MTKRELKKEIDQLRNDMAAEFVKKKGHNFVRITDEIYYK